MYVCICVCMCVTGDGSPFRVFSLSFFRFVLFVFFMEGDFFFFSFNLFYIRWLSRTSHRYTNERRNVLENGSRTHECAIDMSDVSERKDT